MAGLRHQRRTGAISARILSISLILQTSMHGYISRSLSRSSYVLSADPASMMVSFASDSNLAGSSFLGASHYVLDMLFGIADEQYDLTWAGVP